MEMTKEERAKLVRALQQIVRDRYQDPGESERETRADLHDDPAMIDTDIDELGAQAYEQTKAVNRETDRFVNLEQRLEQGETLNLADADVRETVRESITYAVDGLGAPEEDFATLRAAVDHAEQQQVPSQEFVERVARVAEESVNVHTQTDRPVEEVFTELAARDGLITPQGDAIVPQGGVPSGSRAEHIARLEAIARQLDQAIHQLHEHDPEAVVRNSTPDEVAVALRTQEISANSAPVASGPGPGERYGLPSDPALPAAEHSQAPQR